jgi:MFS transporter, putative metabolite:H+ symporter
LEGSKHEWGLRLFFEGILGACYQVGLLFGSILWGYASDKYGRIALFKLSLLLSLLSALILLLSFNQYMVGIGLALIGATTSGEISLAGIMFYEFCPPAKRHYMALMSFFFCIGCSLSPLAAFLTSIFNTTQFYDWRFVVLLGVTIQSLLLITRLSMKESAPYLFSKGNIEEAAKILDYVSVKNKRIKTQMNLSRETLQKFKVNFSTQSEAKEATLKETLIILFGKEYCLTTIILFFVIITQICALLYFHFADL